MAEKHLGLLPRYHRARQRVPGSQKPPSPIPAERETSGGRRQESNDWMKVDPVQGSTSQEDPSRREGRRAGAGRDDRPPNSDNAPKRGLDGATQRLGSSTSTGTAAGKGRRATNSTPAEGLISSRTRARTRLAATISARSSDGGRGRQLFTGLFRGVSPHQPTMARMESPATHSRPAQSLPEQPPDTSGASQPPTAALVPPTTAPLYTWGFGHTRHRMCAAKGRSTVSTWGFKHTRHRRCAANGRDTTADIRACIGTNLRVTLTTACIKGGVSIVDTALPSDTSARLDPSDDTPTAVSYLSIHHHPQRHRQVRHRHYRRRSRPQLAIPRQGHLY